MMKIRCVCLVRDEADVLGHTLNSALQWADAIYVLDNGSSDGTWELLEGYAKRYPQVVLMGREYSPYRHSLWGEIANRFLREARKGDWWCRLDADEIYVDDPRKFLRSVFPWEKIVWSVSIQYYFTDIDLAAYERDPRTYLERWRPEILRFYRANWSEPRFVRHIPGVQWLGPWPAGFYELRSARKRIRLRHYQYRSPPQIQHRLHLRLQTIGKTFLHEKAGGWLTGGLREQDLAFPAVAAMDQDLWRARVLQASALDQDEENGEFRIDWKAIPQMWGRESLFRRTLSGVLNRLWRTAS